MIHQILRVSRVCVVAACVPLLGARAQRSSTGRDVDNILDTHWYVSGEVGALVGGTWLSGPTIPTVTSGAGAQVALSAMRAVRPRLYLGAALRVGAQSLRLAEHDVRWDGGTLTDVQIVGAATVTAPPRHLLQSEVNVSAGLTSFSGAGALAPFALTPRVSPVADIGVTFRRARSNDEINAEREPHPFALYARLSIVRVDPTSSATFQNGQEIASAGWVRRMIVGMRVQR